MTASVAVGGIVYGDLVGTPKSNAASQQTPFTTALGPVVERGEAVFESDPSFSFHDRTLLHDMSTSKSQVRHRPPLMLTLC